MVPVESGPQQQNGDVKGFSGGPGALKIWRYRDTWAPLCNFFLQLDVSIKKDSFTSGIGSEDAKQVCERRGVEKL